MQQRLKEQRLEFVHVVSILYEADRLCNSWHQGKNGDKDEVSILYEADRLCNRSPSPYSSPYQTCFNPLRGRQTLQRDSWPGPQARLRRFNPLRGRQTLQLVDEARACVRGLVSILYEADRLCNITILHTPLPGVSVFQSSTRQTDFATASGQVRPSTPTAFQSSTRQTDFATAASARTALPRLVSILYEADRLCNLEAGGAVLAIPRCFNPLRGRQTLQQGGGVPLEAVGALVSILYEADRLCNCPCQEAAPDRGS